MTENRLPPEELPEVVIHRQITTKIDLECGQDPLCARCQRVGQRIDEALTAFYEEGVSDCRTHMLAAFDEAFAAGLSVRQIRWAIEQVRYEPEGS